MATRTKPLVTAATLASAAAIAIASPAIAPSLTLPTPHALSAAKVQLATFADVLSIPAVEWTDLLFGNTTWGGVLSATNYGDASAKPQDQFGQPGYVNPWAVYCTGSGGAGTCDRTGLPGAAYLFTDALVNGDGKGWDPANPGAGWTTGVVNYFWEPSAVVPLGGGSSPTFQIIDAGLSAAAWYLAQTTLGTAVPSLTIPLAAGFWGERNVSVFYNLGLSIVAGVIGQVPVVGPLTGNSILAYLGDLEIPDSGGSFYQYGLSGALNYWIDIATGAVPFPTSLGAAAATTPAAPAASAATLTASETPAVSADVKPVADVAESTPAVDAKVSVSENKADDTAEVKASESTPEVKAPESTPAVEAPESTPEVEAPEVKVPDSTPAVTETKPVAEPEVSVPEVKDIAPAADTASKPAKPAVKHPVRDAVEKVGKQINSAISNAKAAAKEAKAAKADKADSAS